MHGFDLSSDALRCSPLWYRGSNTIVDAVRYARSCSHSHHAVIRVYDAVGNVIERRTSHGGDFKEVNLLLSVGIHGDNMMGFELDFLRQGITNVA